MTTQPYTTRDLQSQAVRLNQFIHWLIGTTLGTAAVLGLLCALNPVPQLIWGALSLVCYAGLVLLARAQLRRQFVARAVTLMGLGLLCLAALNVALSPAFYPVFLTLPIMAIALALPYVTTDVLRWISVGAVGASVFVIVAGQTQATALPFGHSLIVVMMTGMGTAGVALITLLLWQFHCYLTETLARTQAANASLHALRDELELQLAEQSAELHFSMAELEHRCDYQAGLLSEIEQQRAVIRELSVPVLPVGHGTLVMPLVGVLDSERLQGVRTRALQTLERAGATQLLLDITGVPVVDTFVAQELLSVVQAARLLGAEVTLVGIRPEVAQALVSLGVDLSAVRTSSDVQSVLQRHS